MASVDAMLSDCDVSETESRERKAPPSAMDDDDGVDSHHSHELILLMWMVLKMQVLGQERGLGYVTTYNFMIE